MKCSAKHKKHGHWVRDLLIRGGADGALRLAVGYCDEKEKEEKKNIVIDGNISPGKNRHFTDVLLNAREEFIAEDRGSAKYLNNNNLRQVILDIFGAGTGTSGGILSYCFIRLANDPNLQEELRSEVMTEIGARRCTHEDRGKMPKVDSFLQEIMRYYPAAPLSLPRKAMEDVSISESDLSLCPDGFEVSLQTSISN